ncbi:MAG: glycosyltransferase family 2 protein [Deltaproteobacteria bacterium]|nr:glycosyltransferase family 2 protein [Deltaproteobacteria bacterium]MBZ0219547.1 glycosyltransferase family 2 protein [Deltaproteobacteria bacterium]
MEARILVCIPSYRNPERLKECLARVSSIDRRGRTVETLVVDSGTDPAELEKVVGHFENVELVTMENRGYVGCVNAGLRRAIENGFEYMLVVTDDARVESGILDGLMPPLAADERAAISGCKIIHVSKDREGGVKKVVMPGGFLGHWAFPRSRNIPEDSTELAECDWVNGAVLAMKVRVFREIGLLDESFFMYFDELDLGLKLKRAGYHAIYNPRVRVVHESGSGFYGITSGKGGAYARYYLTRNVALLYYKKSLASFVYFLPYYLVISALRSAVLTLRGRPDCGLAVLRGVKDFFAWNLGRGPY